MASVVDAREAIRFLQEMIRIDSTNPPGNEHRVAEWLADRLSKLRLPVKVTKVGENRSNLEVRLKGTGKKTLLFCGHMDTVSPGDLSSWSYPPFSGTIEGNRLYGRGASDMKSGLAAMVLAVESLWREGIPLDGDLVFLATAGEEVDSCGAREYLESAGMDDVDALVIGEPTNGKVAVGHKGALWLEITTHGKTAHGSMPKEGINAIDHMIRFLDHLKKYERDWKRDEKTLGESSITVTRINGGIQTNVIPDRCVAHLDIRSVPPQDHRALIAAIERMARDLSEKERDFRAQVRPLLDRNPVLTPASADIIQIALKLKGQSEKDVCGVSYYTDGSVLNAKSEIPMLIYGPGDEKLAHQPDEWVDLDAYVGSVSFYKELALQFLGTVHEN